MVSLRRASAPASPPNVAGALELPDDPPPTPPQLPRTNFTSVRPSPPESSSQQRPNSATNGTTSASASVQNGAHTPHRAKNGAMEHANGHAENANRLTLSASDGSHELHEENEDSDAPEVESATAAAASARAQLAKEKNVRSAARESRRARRREAREERRRGLEERKRLESQIEDASDKAKAERQEREGEERKMDNVEVPLLLPDEVLQATESAVGASRKAEKERRRKERLKRQRIRVAKSVATKKVNGIEVEVVGSTKNRFSSKGKRNRNTAAGFLRKCMNKAGVRVSATTAARMASSAKIRKT